MVLGIGSGSTIVYAVERIGTAFLVFTKTLCDLYVSNVWQTKMQLLPFVVEPTQDKTIFLCHIISAFEV